MKRIILGAIASLLLATPAVAGQREIPVGILKNGLPLTVSKGHGLVISFIPVNETAYRAWLSNPSRIVFDSDGGLCAQTSENCTNTGSQVLFLKAINPIPIDGLPESSDKTTVFTVLTKGSSGTSLYQFKLSTGESDITLINVVPDLESNNLW